MTEIYADVIVDISVEKLDKPFQYVVPEKFFGILETGMCVQIPFGPGNKLIKGYVTGLSDVCQFDRTRMKEIKAVVRNSAEVEDRMIALAGWMKTNYGSTMIQALKTVIPAKKTVKQVEQRILVRRAGMEELLSMLQQSRNKKQVAKERLIEALINQEQIPLPLITGKLGVSMQTVNSLVKAEAATIETYSSYRNPVKLERQEEQRKCLSADQQQIITDVLADYDAGNPGTYLIHGITGSGKTEVYMGIIEQMVERGKQSIVLIPEIALTYQTLSRFYKRFGDRVSVMNSTLSAGEKYDQCQRAKNGEIDVIIGPRSALFTPFKNLGAIVIDEEQEDSYKSETTPKYHARETAEWIARQAKCALVLGSATPSLEAYYRAKTGSYKLYTLTERLTGGSLPKVSVVDLREELQQGNRSIFSRRLQELLTDRLQKGEQSMLFLNRRGYAGFISCRACGEVMKCPHCDVSLSQHEDGRLVCHYCGYNQRKPDKCPKCGSPYILGFKAGTQQVEERLQALFPGIRTLRMDADTTKTKDSYEKILSAFANKEADVLIGTQMIVKGHDFPQVTLVGILAADLSLFSADYRSSERTFQILTQAVGRAGRGTLPGDAVIQTYQPEHYAVTFAANQDYEGFYEEEIAYRQLAGYPPVEHMLAVWCYDEDENRGKQFADLLASYVREYTEQEKLTVMVRILGPAPATVRKINDIFRYVFYIKAKEYDKLVKCKDMLETRLKALIPQKNQMVAFDFNPQR